MINYLFRLSPPIIPHAKHSDFQVTKFERLANRVSRYLYEVQCICLSDIFGLRGIKPAAADYHRLQGLHCAAAAAAAESQNGWFDIEDDGEDLRI